MIGLLILAVVFGLAGLACTLKGFTLPAGILKVLSVAGIGYIGIAGFSIPLVTIGFVVMVLAEIAMSLLSPLTKKELFFFIGLGLYMISYGAIATGIFTSIAVQPYIIGVYAIMVLIGLAQFIQLDKADGIMRGVLAIYIGVLTAFVTACVMYNPIFALLGALSIYFSDSIIGQSKFNSKFVVSNTIKEISVSIPFITGLAMFAISSFL
jgi:hypothetical protein